MKRKIIATFLAAALLLSALPLHAGAVGASCEKPEKKGYDVFPYIQQTANWMNEGLANEEWAWGYKILYWMVWPFTRVVDGAWKWIKPMVRRIAVPILGLFNPPLPEFVPKPEPPPPTVAKHPIAGYKILYQGAGSPDETAARILADTLNEITSGTAFTAVMGAKTGSDEFLVGAVSGADVTALGADGYLIEEDGSVITIAGGKRGVLYGVYKFLEKYFDCRWYTHDFKVIPKGPAMIAQVKRESYAPVLEYRETDWISPRYETYSLANGLNGNVYRSLAADKGGTFGYNGGMAHTIINNFLRPGKPGSGGLFDQYPDWYAYRESVKTQVPKQLCLTNPQVLARMKLDVINQLATGNGQPIVSVTQDDNQDYCQCSECKRVDAEEGSHAGTMIRFVNAIADAVKAAGYNDALIDTFAYQYTRTPPKITKPRDNVIIRLCSIECCFAHPLDDPKCPENVKFAKDIKTWKEICNHLYIWDYTTNYAHYNCIFPDFGVLQQNMRFFVANNVKGVYEEGNYQAAACNSEFAELRAYLLSRLMFDPDIDYSAEMNGFLKAYYGGGWQYMREFIDLTIANAGTKRPHSKLGIFIRPDDKDVLKLKLNQLRYADALWAKAIEFAGDSMAGAETCKQRVLRSQLSWRFWKGCNKALEFWRLQPDTAWQAANEQLYHDFKAFGITQYREGWSAEKFNWRFLPEPPPDWWGTPMDWHG